MTKVDKKLMLSRLVLTLCHLFASVTNVIAGTRSSFIRSEWPSVDIPLNHEVCAVPKGHNATQQVHITQGDYDGKAVIVSWVTPGEPGLSQVQYGTSVKKYDFAAEGTFTNYTFCQYKSGHIHQCLLDDLKHDTKYYYKIDNGESSCEFWFQTPPKINPDTSCKFGIIEWSRYSVVRWRYKYNDVGIRWDTWGHFVEPYQPWIWCAGNHEIEHMPYMREVTPFKSYLHRYPTPHLASKSSNPLWYAVRSASAHIIVLSSYSPFVKYTPQWRWLREELTKVNREETPWLIVLMHVPMYNSNEAHFMEGESMRVVFKEWFVHFKVDMIFAGHLRDKILCPVL